MTTFEPRGILPAMITPLTEEGEVNERALRKLIQHLLEGGVHGIFAIGTTGEFYGLSEEEYFSILELTCDEVGGRVPVYAGANHITTRGCVKLASIAEKAGVDALSVLTPMFISPTQSQLYEHYRAIAESTSLPIVLYNNLPKTNVTITPDTAHRLAQVPNIVGIKDSSGDLTLTAEYIRRTRDQAFGVMIGRDTLIHACLCYGGSGGVAACANVAPRLCADIYDRFLSGDREGSLEAQFRLAPLRIAFTLGTFPTVIKESLELIGIEAGPCFGPVGSMTDEERGRLKEILVQMELLR
jgi:4-hydroxy-tetrahydrodipicolinate synthase